SLNCRGDGRVRVGGTNSTLFPSSDQRTEKGGQISVGSPGGAGRPFCRGNRKSGGGQRNNGDPLLPRPGVQRVCRLAETNSPGVDSTQKQPGAVSRLQTESG